jgi:hypothetical protein
VTKKEPRAATVWRLGGVAVSLVWPAILVWLSASAVRRAVSGGVADSFAPRVRNASNDPVLVEDINSQIASASLDRTLIVYLGVAGFIAVVGAALRVVSHGAPSATVKGIDFAGKCLALSSAVVAFAAAQSRFGDAGVSPYIPAQFELIAFVAVIFAVTLVWFIGFRAAIAKG